MDKSIIFRIEKKYCEPLKKIIKKKGYATASEFFREKVRELIEAELEPEEKEVKIKNE